jgi:hypothetical protein
MAEVVFGDFLVRFLLFEVPLFCDSDGRVTAS